MQIEDNEGGGKTVFLTAGDDLTAVPRSHRHLLTPGLRAAFPDPKAYFATIAARCPFPKMARWLRALLKEDRWELHLHRGFTKDFTSAGYDWQSERVRGAMVGLPEGQDLAAYPEELQRYFRLVDVVHWNGFGCAGGLCGADGHTPLTCFAMDYHGAAVDIRSTFVWGYSPCGDMLIYTADGRGGWLNHGSHEIRLLGSIGDTIDWVFAELLADRSPDFPDD